MIYALLGPPSADKDMPLPKPDYSKLVHTVYCEYFEAIIRHRGDLDILHFLDVNNLLSPHNLPSWALDLSSTHGPYAHNMTVEHPRFKASADSGGGSGS
jgi:hypothetical protein